MCKDSNLPTSGFACLPVSCAATASRAYCGGPSSAAHFPFPYSCYPTLFLSPLVINIFKILYIIKQKYHERKKDRRRSEETRKRVLAILAHVAQRRASKRGEEKRRR